MVGIFGSRYILRRVRCPCQTIGASSVRRLFFALFAIVVAAKGFFAITDDFGGRVWKVVKE